MTDHLVIFDTQLRPGVNSDFCLWMGQYIEDNQPDKIILIGDWWDMPSLSTYDNGGSLKAVGRNYQNDIDAGLEGIGKLLRPFTVENRRKSYHKKKQYRPDMFFTLGNHEERINKFVNDNPTLLGKVGISDLKLVKLGFQVLPFLEPVHIDGVQYVHYVKNKNSNYPKASAKATIEQTFMSTIQGHKPGLDVYTVWSDRTGRNAWSIINGSSYYHDEDYRKGGGNNHWRGILHLRNVIDGDFDPEFISMKALKEKYGGL
jgi:hypothetical protein